jgi:hypothetical protein
MSFNLQGTRYAAVNLGCQSIFLADFDRCSGILTNPRIFKVPQNLIHPATTTIDTFIRGVCFSSNDSFLYVSTKGNIYQLELNNPDSSTAWYHVANLDTVWAVFQGYASIYHGPDGKLYVGNQNALGKAMSVINIPNAKGAACDFCPKCLRFGHIGTTAPPCMPNYALGKDTTVNCWPMGVGQVKQELPILNVYPNPATSSITIESEGLKQGRNQLQVYNLMGQLVLQEYFSAPNGKYRVSLMGIAAGVYMLRVNGVVRRLVIE